MFTTEQKKRIYNNWAQHGLEAMKILKKNPNDEKAKVEVDVSAAALAELDRSHKKKETQILQDYVWEQGYLSGECPYERYEKSGYFKEKYRKPLDN